MKTIQHLIISAGVVGGIGIAYADEDAAAAFARGQAALKAHKVHEACDAFTSLSAAARSAFAAATSFPSCS